MKSTISINSVKIQNRKLVFKELAQNDNITRTEIATRCGLSMATVSTIVEEFVKRGLVIEEKDTSSTVGRKPNFLRLRPSVQKIGTIDLTSEQSFIFMLKDMTLQTDVSIHHAYDPSQSFGQNLHLFLSRVADELQTNYKEVEWVGVGISVPGPYQADQDTVRNKRIPYLNNIHIKQEIKPYFPEGSVVIDQDVKFALKSELVHLQDVEDKTVFLFHLGEGVGGALSIAGTVYGGASGFAGDIGQMMVENGVNLEQLVNWQYFVRQASLACGLDRIDEHEVVSLYLSGEENVRQIVDEVVRNLVTAMINLAWLYNPHIVILDGKYRMLGETFICKIHEQVQERLHVDLVRDMNIIYSQTDEKSTLMGAAATIREQWLESFNPY